MARNVGIIFEGVRFVAGVGRWQYLRIVAASNVGNIYGSTPKNFSRPSTVDQQRGIIKTKKEESPMSLPAPTIAVGACSREEFQ